MKRILTCLAACLILNQAQAQQQCFPKEIPAGNYSGICAIGDDRYAVVSDKSAEDGFFVFHITVDSIRGRISAVKNEGFRSSGQPNSDLEAICYCRDANTLFAASEQTSEVCEYALDGRLTGRRLQMPAAFKKSGRNVGLESLTYDATAQRFYLTTEHPLPGDSLHRIQAFNLRMEPTHQYLYRPDAPLSAKHIWGVSELCAVGDGRLLVLERQVYVPKRKIGATTLVRLYEVRVGESEMLSKRLLKEFKTKLTLLNRSFANYEGMCLVRPDLLLMVADSQNQYGGVLRDWMRVLRW